VATLRGSSWRDRHRGTRQPATPVGGWPVDLVPVARSGWPRRPGPRSSSPRSGCRRSGTPTAGTTTEPQDIRRITLDPKYRGWVAHRHARNSSSWPEFATRKAVGVLDQVHGFAAGRARHWVAERVIGVRWDHSPGDTASGAAPCRWSYFGSGWRHLFTRRAGRSSADDQSCTRQLSPGVVEPGQPRLTKPRPEIRTAYRPRGTWKVTLASVGLE
jgi:hypothetical protein